MPLSPTCQPLSKALNIYGTGVKLEYQMIALFICCSKAALVGEIPSSCLLPFTNICHLALLIFVCELVQSYKKITNLSIDTISSSVISCQVLQLMLLKVGVMFSNEFLTSQAVFLPLPLNEDTISHPVKAWKSNKASAFSLPNFSA